MSKLFIAELTVQILVLADSEEDADEKIMNNDYFGDELAHNGYDISNVVVTSFDTTRHYGKGWEGSYPYGEDADRTVVEILKEESK